MTEPARHLHPVPSGEIPDDAPSYGEALRTLAELADENAGLLTTIRSQSGLIGKLDRKLKDVDLANHPQREAITGLIDYWKSATHHPNAKYAKARIDLVKARFKDGYSVKDLELALDGLAAFPFRNYGDRLATGTDAQRNDAMSVALGSGEDVERFAVMGHHARKAKG